MPTLRVDGPVGRVVQRMAGSPAFAKLAPPIITPLDKLVHRLSGGAEIWPRLLEMWPTYDRYVERSGRNLRVFRLTRA